MSSSRANGSTLATRARSAAVALLFLLPLATVVLSGPAEAVRSLDYGYLGAAPVQTLDLTLPAAAAPGVTLELPLNKNATIIEAAVDLMGGPLLNETVLKGWGTLERNREDFGLPMGKGDFNGDGKSDLVTGAPMRTIPDSPGRIEVRYGRAGPVTAAPNWQYEGPSGIQFGGTFASGDFNGDNFDDLLVGEQNFGYQGTPPEQAFVFYGSAAGLASTPGVVLESDQPQIETGYANAVTVSDLNADGYDDAVITDLKPTQDPLQGRLWIHWGGPAGINASNYSFAYPPSPGYFEFGYDFFPIGDSDRDGRGEIFTGSVAYNDRSGGALVMEGTASGTAVNWVWDFNGNRDGYVVRDGFAAGADITGDGFADIIVGYNAANDTRGGLLIVPGMSNGSYNTSAAVKVLGENAGDSFSDSAMMGDVDGDGLADLAVGATHTYSDAEGGIYLFTKGELAFEQGGFIPVGLKGSAEGCGDEGAFLGDLNGDGAGDFGFACPFGVNGSYTPGTVHVFYGNRHPFPENATMKVAGSPVWSQPGAMKGPASPTGLAAAISAYLANATADASGMVRVPLALAFENGGKLSVKRIYVRYTVLVEPGSVAAVSDPSGEAVVVAWAVRSPKSDGDMTAVWSNKTGPWAVLANVASLRGSFVDLEVIRGTTYWYRLTEWDALLGLHSDPSANVSATATDTKPPAPPIVQQLTIDDANTRVTLQWAPASDDTAQWEIWRKDGEVGAYALVGTVPRAQVAFSDAGLEAEVNLTWKVRAVDASGIASPFSEERTGRLRDLQAPPRPLDLAAQALPSGTAVALNWTLNTYDTVGYAVLVSAPNTASGFDQVGTTAGASYTVTGLQRGAQYHLHVEAIDRAGQHSTPADAIVFTTDEQAPEAPVILAVEPLPAGRAVHITWSSADDDVASFHIAWKQGGVNGAGADPNGEAREFVVANLVNDLPVEIRVSAADGVGQRSADSAPVTAVPHDQQPPAAPTGVRVTPLPEGGGLKVEWTAPADADVAGYNVYFRAATSPEGPALAGAVGGRVTTFEKRGLQNLVTYVFYVRAIDYQANEGEASLPGSSEPRDSEPPAVPRLDELPTAWREAAIEVTGRGDPSVQIEFTVNGLKQESATTTVGANGRFTATIDLKPGDNTLTAHAFDASPSVDASAHLSADTAPKHIVRDQQSPSVKRTTPGQGATGISAQGPITVEFSEPVLPETVQAILSTASGEEVSAQISFEDASTITVTPDRALAAGTTYTLKLRGADAAGNALVASDVTFTTASEGGGDLLLFGASAAVIAVASALALARRRRASGDD